MRTPPPPARQQHMAPCAAQTPAGGRALYFGEGGGAGGRGRYSPLAEPPPQKGAQLTGPQDPTETDPRAPGVTRTQKFGQK